MAKPPETPFQLVIAVCVSGKIDNALDLRRLEDNLHNALRTTASIEVKVSTDQEPGTHDITSTTVLSKSG